MNRLLFALGASFSLGAVLAVACAQFTPPHDPSEWPCGDPRSKYCPGRADDGQRTCCLQNEICGTDSDGPWGCAAGYCCANEPIPTIRARQLVSDAGTAAP